MKKHILFLAIAFGAVNAHAQVFKQDFEKSKKLNAYYSNKPDNSQFNLIEATGTSIAAIKDGKLKLAKTAAGNDRPYLLRTTPLDASSQFLALSFTMSAKAQGDATSYLAFGSEYEESPLPDDVPKSYVRLLFHLLSDGFSIRNSNQGVDGPNKYTGEQKIMFVMNHSGKTQNYTAPDGSAQTLANDRWDLWVGNTQEFDEAACTNTNRKIDNLKFSLLSSISEVTLDDIEIKDLAKQS